MCQVGCPVQLGICLDGLAAAVHVAVDEGCESWKLGDQVQSVLVGGLPVFKLVDALGVGCSKLALRLQAGQIQAAADVTAQVVRLGRKRSDKNCQSRLMWCLNLRMFGFRQQRMGHLAVLTWLSIFEAADSVFDHADQVTCSYTPAYSKADVCMNRPAPGGS